MPAVVVTLKTDGELVIHGRGSARYAVQLPVASYIVSFAIWDTNGATQGELAEVNIGPCILFTGTARDHHRRKTVDISAAWLE